MKRIVKETGVRDVVTKSLRKTKSAGHETSKARVTDVYAGLYEIKGLEVTNTIAKFKNRDRW